MDKKKKDFHGLPIVSFSELTICSRDGIILAMKRDSQEFVLNELKKRDLSENCLAPRFVGNEKKECGKYCLPGLKKTGKYFDGLAQLETIGKNYGTDKCSLFHDYLKKYEFFLSKYKNERITLLELGIYQGASLKMWSEYFPQAKIVGVDIDKRCKRFENGKIVCKIRDLSEWENLVELSTCKPSIIVDDASHIWSHQIKALFALFPELSSGGIYILEDITTSFLVCEGMVYQDAPYSAYDVLCTISRAVTNGEYLTEATVPAGLQMIVGEMEELAREVDMITFIHGSCVIVKK